MPQQTVRLEEVLRITESPPVCDSAQKIVAAKMAATASSHSAMVCAFPCITFLVRTQMMISKVRYAATRMRIKIKDLSSHCNTAPRMVNSATVAEYPSKKNKLFFHRRRME